MGTFKDLALMAMLAAILWVCAHTYDIGMTVR